MNSTYATDSTNPGEVPAPVSEPIIPPVLGPPRFRTNWTEPLRRMEAFMSGRHQDRAEARRRRQLARGVIRATPEKRP